MRCPSNRVNSKQRCSVTAPPGRRHSLTGVSLIPPEAVADITVLLASDRFRYTTGDILTVDGGLPEEFPR